MGSDCDKKWKKRIYERYPNTLAINREGEPDRQDEVKMIDKNVETWPKSEEMDYTHDYKEV